MDTELATTSHASKERLASLRAALSAISEDLTEKEMDRARLQSELARFQSLYYRAVGRLYAELDEVLAGIAEKKAARNPEEDILAAEARRRRGRAERSSREYRQWVSGDGNSSPPSAPPPSESAKKLYRKIAAELHPDLAKDEQARAIRTALMADLNEAYAQGDIRRMRDILETWKKSPEAVPGDDLEAEVERLERTIEQMRKKLESIRAEMEKLKNSSLYRLMLRNREASRRGRDLLAELVEEINRKIALARKELAEI